MQIEIKPHNHFRSILRRIASKSEDIILALLLWLTNYWQPDFLMGWIDRYTQKRVTQLQRDHIHDQWRIVSLEDVVQHIREKEQG